jgi:hypothetical protein
MQLRQQIHQDQKKSGCLFVVHERTVSRALMPQ